MTRGLYTEWGVVKPAMMLGASIRHRADPELGYTHLY